MTVVRLDDLSFEAARPSRAFIESIRAHGVLQPLLVTPKPNGSGVRYVVHDGRRRATAARKAGLDTVPVHIMNGAATDLQAWTVVANLHRSRNVASELEALRTLLASGMDRDAVESALGLYRNDAKRLFALLSLIPDAEALLREGRLSPSTALVVAGLSPHHQQEYLDQVAGGKPTLSAAKAFRLRTQFAPHQLRFLGDVIPDVSTRLT